MFGVLFISNAGRLEYGWICVFGDWKQIAEIVNAKNVCDVQEKLLYHSFLWKDPNQDKTFKVGVRSGCDIRKVWNGMRPLKNWEEYQAWISNYLAYES
jgi:hypothetical protein